MRNKLKPVSATILCKGRLDVIRKWLKFRKTQVGAKRDPGNNDYLQTSLRKGVSLGYVGRMKT